MTLKEMLGVTLVTKLLDVDPDGPRVALFVYVSTMEIAGTT